MQVLAQQQIYFLRGEPGQFTELVAASTLPRDESAASMELRESGAAETKGGKKCARRIIPAQKWHEFAEHSVAHDSCIRVKARDTVGAGYILDSPEIGPKVPDTMLAEIDAMLDRSVEALYDACTDWEKTGWMGLECLPARGGKLHQLNHIDSWTLWPCIDKSGYVHARGNGKVFYVPLGVREPESFQLAWLNNNHWFKSTWYGVPDITSVLLQIETAWQALKYNLDFFARRGGYRWMMIIKSGPDSTDKDAAQDKTLIRLINTATKQVGKDSNTDLLSVPVGNREVDFHKLDADVNDLDFATLLKTFRDDIMLAHAVPPIKLGIVETGALGGENAQAQLESYRDGVIIPKQQRWERLIRQIIRVWWGVNVKFEFQRIKIDALAKLAGPVTQLFNANLIPRVEARAKLGEADIDDGEIVWGSMVNQGQITPNALDLQQLLRGER